MNAPSLKTRLNHPLLIGLTIGCLAFCIYTSMYAIRKPFTALVYSQNILGYGIKSWMVLAQLLGYTLSKFVGIKWLGELNRNHRFRMIVFILTVATIPLLLIGYSNCKFWPLWMLLNGFPLGLIWGIVFSYIEGRNLTELIGAILACTFIFSSGLVKSIAILFQENHFRTEMIPFYVASIFLIPAIIFSYMLEKMPQPSNEEIQANAPRTALSKSERKAINKKYFGFLIAIIFLYGFLTLLRDIRDNFGAEIMSGLHIYNAKNLTKLESIITIIMLVSIPFISRVRNHYNAMITTIAATFVGGVICISTYILFKNNLIDGMGLLLFSGGGIYVGYILINISIMNRLIGFNGTPANSGFLVYMADSAGYFCSLFISGFALFSKKGELPWLNWFQNLIFFGGIIVVVFAVIAFYQIRKHITQ